MSIDAKPKIEVINRDLTSKEGWDEFLKAERWKARKLSRKKDPGFADCNLILTRNPFTGEPVSPYLMFVCVIRFDGKTDQDVETQKEDYVALMRSTAVAGGAIASIYRSEAWMSRRVIAANGKMPTFETVPSKDPDRIEALILMTDHRTHGPAGFIAEIKSSPQRDVQPWDTNNAVMTGRFASFVPPLEDVNNKNLVAIARAWLCINQDAKMIEKVAEHHPPPRQHQ